MVCQKIFLKIKRNHLYHDARIVERFVAVRFLLRSKSSQQVDGLNRSPWAKDPGHRKSSNQSARKHKTVIHLSITDKIDRP